LSTVDTQGITNFYSSSFKLTLNGQHTRVPFYARDGRSAGQPSPLMLFPQAVSLKEFRIMPIGIWDQQASFVRTILWLNGIPIVEHKILAADSDREDPRLFDISNALVGTVTSPGGFCYVELWGQSSNPTDQNTYQFQMWGEYLRS